MNDIQSPSSSDGGISDDLSFEEVVPDCVQIEDTELNFLQSVDDIQRAIAKYKDMILETEGCSNNRKWLVRTIIELRYKLELLKENENQSTQNQEKEVIRCGHHFILTKTYFKSSQLKHCDVCCGLVTLLGLETPWYECADCGYTVHAQCAPATRRICVVVTAAEQPGYQLDICPEITLLEQKYKCAECRTPIIFKSGVTKSTSSPGSLSCLSVLCESDNDWTKPRLCDYDGKHYCPSCHWQDEALIPARVLQHWDFTRYPVSRVSSQLLKIMHKRPIINVNAINPGLFGFIEDLAQVKKYREDLLLMKQYLITCRVALEMNLLWSVLEERKNLLKYQSHVFSLKDLVEVKSGTLVSFLESVLQTFRQHITQDCSICSGRGFMCELCMGKSAIFPFDESVYVCEVCQTVYHKHCWLHKAVCTKCERRSRQRERMECGASSEEKDCVDWVEEALELECT